MSLIDEVEIPVIPPVTATVAQYLVQQLQAVGVHHIFGVPGDYVLKLMDYIVDSPIKLVGTCNELNAGYAADAYARLNGVGALCVTYGVGGLSVVNAIAGAYAEEVPLIVISGAPRTSAKGNKLLLHHTTGDYNLQLSILEKVTVAAVTITNPNQAAIQIDQTIAACLRYKRPVYIEIPADIVTQPCVMPLSFERPNALMSDSQALNEAVEEAVEWLEKAQRPVILAGVELNRYKIQHKLQKLIEKTGYPIATTMLGKSAISELHPQFIGNYAGALSRDYVRERVETADCILCLGTIMSDINLGGYTAELDNRKLINANSGKIKISHHYYEPVNLGDFTDKLITKLSHKSFETLDIRPASHLLSQSFKVQPDQKLTNARFYERMNHFIQEDCTVIAETGDAIIATLDLLIHGETRFIGQAFYMSIGYSLPACLGAGLAHPQNRVILFIGDGSFQMTAQAVSTIIRQGLNPIIFLINNDGYTVERLIHDGSYNDIQSWKYHQLPQVFGDSWTDEVWTEGDLEQALETAMQKSDKLCFIEVHLDRFDCCETLARLTQTLTS